MGFSPWQTHGKRQKMKSESKRCKIMPLLAGAPAHIFCEYSGVPWWWKMGKHGNKVCMKSGASPAVLALQLKDSRLGMFSPAWVEVMYWWCICALCDITKGRFPMNWRFLEGTRWKVDWAKQAQGELFFFFFFIYRYIYSLISARRVKQNRNSAPLLCTLRIRDEGQATLIILPSSRSRGAMGRLPLCYTFKP